jgi:hypothetical protein
MAKVELNRFVLFECRMFKGYIGYLMGQFNNVELPHGFAPVITEGWQGGSQASPESLTDSGRTVWTTARWR